MSRRNVLDRAGAAPTKIEKARAMRRDMTLAEARLWAALRRSALEVRVRRQHIVRGWIVDFFIHAAQLVIEVDGDIHDLQVDEDRRRDEALREEGLHVLRVRNDDVLVRLPEVLAQIRALIP
jgi:very-short-patch-repair endonuclease